MDAITEKKAGIIRALIDIAGSDDTAAGFLSSEHWPSEWAERCCARGFVQRGCDAAVAVTQVTAWTALLFCSAVERATTYAQRAARCSCACEICQLEPTHMHVAMPPSAPPPSAGNLKFILDCCAEENEGLVRQTVILIKKLAGSAKCRQMLLANGALGCLVRRAAEPLMRCPCPGPGRLCHRELSAQHLSPHSLPCRLTWPRTGRSRRT